MKKTRRPLIGFVGQGYIGKNYADDFERRGFRTVRYALEKPYRDNKGKIRECDIVFIAVPTPTTPKGFDDSIVRSALSLVGKGKIAVIKSTVLPGTTETLQRDYPEIFILNNPEFLSESTVTHDVANPDCNIVGLPIDTEEYQSRVNTLINLLPRAGTIVCSSREAEFIKYTHNIHGFIEVVYANLLYDLAKTLGVRWDIVRAFIKHDKYMVDRYATPVHASGHTVKAGRGAGGHCFIKDFAAFRRLFGSLLPRDKRGLAMLSALEQKNIELLKKSGKDLDLLKGVYGTSV